MLEYLRIQNLALISDVELEFAPGLNVLTGETGAGKSFILKALNFLTGEKLGADMVRPGRDKAVVEALFSLDGTDTVIKREIAADTGRSRIFLDHSLSSQDAVRALKDRLILHTSQHAQQKLLQPAYQGRILDGFLEDKNLPVERDRLLAELKELAGERERCLERTKELSDKRELLEFQRSEIDKVGPGENEEQELDARRTELRDLEAAQSGVGEALDLLAGPEVAILDGLGQLERRLDDLRRALPQYTEDLEGVQEARQRLLDLETRLRGQRLADSEGMSLEQVESRLFTLAQLKRKLKRSLPEIVALGKEIEDNLSFLDACGLDLKRLDKAEAEAANKLRGALERLNAARLAAADRLCAALVQELKGLGFSEHVDVQCEFAPHELMETRPDLGGLAEQRPRFLWLPNPGQSPQPLDRIASGGELSRFLLALTGLVARHELPTLLFDEVDSGVGGVTLIQVGERLKALAGRQQVVLISHWPQLAALAERHFQVRKEVQEGQTFTLCARLSGQEILAELTRMGGGGDQGEAMARELLGR